MKKVLPLYFSDKKVFGGLYGDNWPNPYWIREYFFGSPDAFEDQIPVPCLEECYGVRQVVDRRFNPDLDYVAPLMDGSYPVETSAGTIQIFQPDRLGAIRANLESVIAVIESTMSGIYESTVDLLEHVDRDCEEFDEIIDQYRIDHQRHAAAMECAFADFCPDSILKNYLARQDAFDL